MFDRWKELKIGMCFARHKIRFLILEEPIKFPIHRVKHEIFIHRHETTQEEG